MWYMGLKIYMGGNTHKYYKHNKFRQNPRGDPKFLAWAACVTITSIPTKTALPYCLINLPSHIVLGG